MNDRLNIPELEELNDEGAAEVRSDTIVARLCSTLVNRSSAIYRYAAKEPKWKAFERAV